MRCSEQKFPQANNSPQECQDSLKLEALSTRGTTVPAPNPSRSPCAAPTARPSIPRELCPRAHQEGEELGSTSRAICGAECWLQMGKAVAISIMSCSHSKPGAAPGPAPSPAELRVPQEGGESFPARLSPAGNQS